MERNESEEVLKEINEEEIYKKEKQNRRKEQHNIKSIPSGNASKVIDVESNIAKSVTEFLTTNKTKIISIQYILNEIKKHYKNKIEGPLSAGYGTIITFDKETQRFKISISGFSKGKIDRIDEITTEDHKAVEYRNNGAKPTSKEIRIEKEPIYPEEKIHAIQYYFSQIEELLQETKKYHK